MTLEPGARLGHYEIQAALGAGGMGEVYHATDTRLGRGVALKVLPALFARDVERLARLEREARTLATLNHPGIAILHGFEEVDGVRFLVMELVEGDTLAAVIANRAPLAPPRQLASERLPLDKHLRPIWHALAIAEQVADALTAAHDRGIVHRDLKPSNVMLDREGRVKLLDFGLAKSVTAPEAEPTRAVLDHSQPGTALGTVPYMSPEQLRGDTLDGRTDIWALGCLLYELLTGTSPFARSTAADTTAAILNEQPDLNRLPPLTPARVRLLIDRCLRKDPRQRLHHVADARLEIADARADLLTPTTSPIGTAGRADVPSTRRPRWAAPATAIALLVAGAIAAWAILGRTMREPAGDLLTFSVPLPGGVSIAPGEVQTYVAVSPDGEGLIVSGGSPRTPLQYHTFRDARARALAGTEGAASPFWSPDGRFVGFFAAGRLMKVALTGGQPQTLTPAAWEAGNSWSTSGVILFAQPTRQGIAIHRVSDEGGEPAAVTTVDPEREIGHFWPHFLPDGRRFLYLCLEKSTGEQPARTLYLASLDDDSRRPIPGIASRAVYVTPGLLVYAADGVLLARPFDADRVMFTGEAVVLAQPVRYFRMTGQSEFSVSHDSSRPVLAVHGGPWRGELILYDRAGARQRAIGPPAAYHQLSVSRNGSQVAVAVLDPTNGGHDLWVHEIDGSRARRLTLNPPDEQSPVWSPDDARIAFRSDVMGPPDLYVQDASGRGEPATLLSRPTVLEPEDWSRDGRRLLFRVASRATGQDQWLLALDGSNAPQPLLNTRYSEWGGRFSPDGRWLAFVSDESGRNEVYVAPLGDPGARRALSVGGGISPRWRSDGREIFYLGSRNTVMAVSLTGDTLSIGDPRALFTVSSPVYSGAFDVTPDGQRFILNQVLDDVAQSPVRVTVNWTRQLAAAVFPKSTP